MQPLERLLKLLTFPVLIIFSFQIPSFANIDSTKIRKSISKVAKRIALGKTVDTGPIGISAEFTKQFSRYIYLIKNASDQELVLLTNHKSPTVRVYAFRTLVSQRYTNCKVILFKHIADTAIVKIRDGCISSTEHLNFYFLELLSPNTGAKEDGKLTAEEVNVIKAKMIEATKHQRVIEASS